MFIGPTIRAMLRSKLRFGLIAVEVALTLAIVLNCATMIQQARTALATKSGFADDELIAVTVRPFDPAYREQAHLDAAVERDIEALRGMPGVMAATSTRLLPWIGGGTSNELRVAGSRRGPYRTQVYNADEATLATLGVELVAGRTFTPDDVRRETAGLRELDSKKRERNPDGTAKDTYVLEVVVSQDYAELVFGSEPAIGKMLEDMDGDRYRIVGIVKPIFNPYAWNIGKHVILYANRTQSFSRGVSYLVRAEPGQVADVMRDLEGRVIAANAGRTVEVQSIADIRTRFNARDTLSVRVLSLVLILVVFVTFLGVVGLTSFSVAERTRQIGIRRALGAQRSDVLSHFLLENAVVSGLGLSLGVALAYGLNIALVSRLGGTALASSTVVLGVGLLALAGILATLAPAMRAARVAPTVATRNV
ncbi:MAG TPA: FtsX-like permease family protein [Polyangiaceae bacterium]|nr:FtsX-like permease family protein [Polyangiaceae bacterium]